MQNSGLQILGLTLGHVPNPVGILEPQMQFAWKGESDKPNATQTAYRIRVSLAGAENEKAVVWDSGKIESSRSSGYPYEGPPLKPATKYEWGVTVWDNHGREAESAPAHFTTGLRDEDWQGCWLGADDYSANDTGAVAPLFRKGFQVDGQVAQAMAYIAVVGYYEFSLNGAKVGNHVLDPGWTDFRQSVLYVAYDVTDQLKHGENAIGLMLGNGWYCNANAPLETIHQGPHFLFQLNIQYADGRLQSEYSQVRKGWQVNTAGPITDNSIYNGETYDARREISGWNTAPVAAAYTKEWRRPLWVDPPAGRLKPQLLPAIQVVKTLAPVDVRRFDDNTRVFDFGQNFSGWVRIRVKGAAGETVCITLCMEVLNRFEGYLLNTAEEGVRYVREVNEDNVKLMLDTFHMNIEESSMTEAIRQAGPLLGHFHTGEPNRMPPGAGRMPWFEIGLALQSIGYEGPVVMEPFVRPGGTVGQNIKIWRDLTGHALTTEELDEMAKQAVQFQKYVLEC